MAEPCANPLLLGWVKEWWDQARDRNSKGASTYKKAYDSLRVCPTKYTHPAQAQELIGFGPKICERLTQKLKDHCEANGLTMPKKPGGTKRKPAADVAGSDDDGSSRARVVKKQRKQLAYVPRFRSGGYGIIVALSTLHEDEGHGMTKNELIAFAQPECDSSYTETDNQGSHYTAWASMKTLLEKELVFAKGGVTKRYNLSDDGWDVAKRIKKAANPGQTINGTFTVAERPESRRSDDDSFQELESDAEPSRPSGQSRVSDVVPMGKVVTCTASLPKFTPIVLGPGTFSVELVLDMREILNKNNRLYMPETLAAKGIKPITRALELGDVTWVAKVNQPNLLSQHGCEGDEVILDYIVERKRLDDLVGSIKDGRFKEQKWRLDKSGIKNKIYIIEEFSGDFSNYETHIATAIASTQVVNGYFVKKTQRMDDTIKYLTSMTNLLKKKYESKPLYVIPTNIITTGNYLPLLAHLATKEPQRSYNITFNAFASLSSKSESLTLRDVYLKMLMCTRGLTGEKAIELQKRWPTPNELVEAYREIDKKEGPGEQARKRKSEMVANEMGHLVGRKKIQKALSAKIAEVWG